MYKYQNKKDKAIDMFERVLKLNPGNKDVKKIISQLKFNAELKEVNVSTTTLEKSTELKKTE